MLEITMPMKSRELARSALPHAPVVPERIRAARRRPVRRAMAGGLRFAARVEGRLADRLDATPVACAGGRC
jgi:hypothetical protein